MTTISLLVNKRGVARNGPVTQSWTDSWRAILPLDRTGTQAGQRGNISASNHTGETKRELLLEQSHGSHEGSGLENKESDMM